ncbi:MAG: hypothetical protein SFW36_06775 [Leptolyngbyaceae cyanobacterium bins.59]|nr:hypothetical protein [Leptolyngbyaceae cyanobacterium bins.59]
MTLLKQLFRQWYWIAGGSITVLLLSTVSGILIGSYTPTIASAPSLPSTCLPQNLPGIRNPASELKLKQVSSTRYQGKEYRLYDVTRPATPMPFPYVVQIQGASCKGIYSNPMGDPDDYFHLAMPLPVARQLTLGRLQAAIQQAGGLPAFRDRLQRSQQQYGGVTQMAEEEVWAYQQMGLALPDNVRVVKATTR